MKTKEEITREDLKQNIMKKIIFRFDYEGIIDIEKLVAQFVEKFRGSFKKYVTTTFNYYDNELINIDDISNILSIPVSEISKQEIHRFTENTFGSDSLSLDIGKYNTILMIDCTNYTTINHYIDFISQYIQFLIAENEFFDLKRCGIRKLGSKIYYDLNNIHEDFEKEYLNISFVDKGYVSYRNRYEDTLFATSPYAIINFIRTFQSGLYYDEDANKEIEAFQVLLDVEGYLTQDILLKENYKQDFENILQTLNNKHLFEIYKLSVTQEFLNKNSK